MRSLAAAMLILAACSTGPAVDGDTPPTTPAETSTSTSTVTSTTTIDPDRQSGIRFTELLTLDRLGSGDDAAVVVLVHGGGWYGGDRSSTQPLAQVLAEAGYVVINATYRTEAGGFPESVEDVVCATIAARTIAAEVGGTGPMILVGHSAGAHIASLVALAGDRFPPEDCAFGGAWQPVDGFVGLAGPYKIQNLFGLLDEWMGAGFADDPDRWAAAVPESYVDGQVQMPVRLVHGDADRIINISFSRLFAEELAGVAGRDVELVEIPDGAHSSMLAPLMDMDVTLAVIDELVTQARTRADAGA